MRIQTFNSKEEWLDGRIGKITGSKLGDLITKRGTGKKIGYYQLIADRLGIPADDEKPMDRGSRLESEAIEAFQKSTGKKVDTSLVIWSRDDNKDIAFSPDGFIGETEMTEVKCLASARHIEAWLTKKIPSDYDEQVIQAFIVNEKLEKLYFIFYDPRLIAKPFFYFTVERSEVQEKVTEYLLVQQTLLAEIEEIVNNLTF